jgi:hypothetical protein
VLGPTPVAIDELVRQSGLASALVQTTLLKSSLPAVSNDTPVDA